MKIAIISTQKINKHPNGKPCYVERELNVNADGNVNFNQFLITDRLVAFKQETYVDENQVQQTQIVRELFKEDDCTIRNRKLFTYTDAKVMEIINVVNTINNTNLNPITNKNELFLQAMIIESNQSNNGAGLYGCNQWISSENFIGTPQ